MRTAAAAPPASQHRRLASDDRICSCSASAVCQQFFYFFKTLVGKPVVVELKNDISLRGRLHSVDQYLNIKLDDMQVVDADKHPHLSAVNSCFIRGSVVRSPASLQLQPHTSRGLGLLLPSPAC